MDAQSLRTQLQNLISQEIEHAQQLLQCLGDEQAALSTDAEAVERIAADKRHRVESLEQLHRQRIQLLSEAGYSCDRPGMDACVRQCDSSGLLQDKWNRLLTLIGECRKGNQVNGAVVEMSRRNIRHTLAILHGQTPQTETYSPSGQTSDSNFSRTLAKA